MSWNDALLDAFPAELRSRRLQAGLSQEALALRADVNRTSLAKLELARNQPIRTVPLNVAEALDVELPDLRQGALSRRLWVRRTSTPRRPAPPHHSE